MDTPITAFLAELQQKHPSNLEGVEEVIADIFSEFCTAATCVAVRMRCAQLCRTCHGQHVFLSSQELALPLCQSLCVLQTGRCSCHGQLVLLLAPTYYC